MISKWIFEQVKTFVQSMIPALSHKQNTLKTLFQMIEKVLTTLEEYEIKEISVSNNAQNVFKDVITIILDELLIYFTIKIQEIQEDSSENKIYSMIQIDDLYLPEYQLQKLDAFNQEIDRKSLGQKQDDCKDLQNENDFMIQLNQSDFKCSKHVILLWNIIRYIIEETFIFSDNCSSLLLRSNILLIVEAKVNLLVSELVQNCNQIFENIKNFSSSRDMMKCQLANLGACFHFQSFVHNLFKKHFEPLKIISIQNWKENLKITYTFIQKISQTLFQKSLLDEILQYLSNKQDSHQENSKVSQYFINLTFELESTRTFFNKIMIKQISDTLINQWLQFIIYIMEYSFYSEIQQEFTVDLKKFSLIQLDLAEKKVFRDKSNKTLNDIDNQFLQQFVFDFQFLFLFVQNQITSQLQINSDHFLQKLFIVIQKYNKIIKLDNLQYKKQDLSNTIIKYIKEQFYLDLKQLDDSGVFIQKRSSFYNNFFSNQIQLYE